MATVESLDHLVLTVRDLAATEAFYCSLLGMELRRFGEGRQSLHFGRQKINLHLAGAELKPNAAHALPGSADLCFLAGEPVAEIATRLEAGGVPVELGPVPRTGAEGPILSIYCRDPDGNLIELSNAIEE